MAGLSSSERQTVERAIQALTQAVENQQQGSPPHRVLSHYCRGLRLLLPLLASPRCSGRFRENVRQKCCQYVSETRHLLTVVLSDHAAFNDADIETVTRVNDDTTQDAVRNGDVSTATNDVMVFQKFGQRPEDDVVNDANRPSSKIGTRTSADQISTESETCCQRRDLTRDDGVNQSSTGAAKKKKKSRKCRKIYCEVATVEINSPPSRSRGDEVGHSDTDSGDEAEVEAEAEARHCALREAEEVDALARQFLTEEEIQGIKTLRGLDDDAEDELSRRQAMVQKVLDAIVCTKPRWGTGDSWVCAPGVGLEAQEIALRDRLVLPLTFPKMVRCCPYLLLHGHPGNGILPLLRHLNKAWGTYQSLMVSGHHLLQAAVSGTVSERDLIKGLFARATQSAPCALCVLDFEVFGHVDSQFEGTGLESTARALKVEMMVHMEELGRQPDVVILVGVTSQPWFIDAALRRRFSFRKGCPGPTAEERVAVVVEALKQVPAAHSLRQNDLRRIAERTSLFSRADMWALVDEALAVMRVRVQKAKHFKPLFSTPQPPPSAGTVGDTTRRPISSDSRPSSSLDETQRDIPQQECRGRTLESSSHQTARELVAAKAEDSVAEAWEDSVKEMDESCRETNKSDRTAQNEPRLLPEAFGQEAEVSGWAPKSFGQEGREENVGDKKLTTIEEGGLSSRKSGATTTTDHLSSDQFQRHNNVNESPEMEDDRQPASRINIDPENGGVSDAACAVPKTQHPPSTDECGAADAAAEQDCTPKIQVMYTPCQADDKDSVPMTWLDVEARCLQEPELMLDDILTAIRYVGEGVSEDDDRRLREWREEFDNA